jgi:hypothetical protein
MRFREHFRPVELPPDVDDKFLELLAESYMGQPCKVSVPHHPIRTGDEIMMITAGDGQIRQEIQLQALREEDKMPPAPAASKAPPTMRQVLNQAPPRAHSREIQLPWEIAKPELAARERVLATLDLQNAIQEPAQRKAFLTRVRDDSWEKTSERAFGFPIKFDTEVKRMEEGNVIPCLADFEELAPKWQKAGTVHVSPKIPVSFPIAIKAVFNDQTANVTIQNNTPASKVEEMLSIRWGVQVQFAPNQSLVWAPNKQFKFVSTIPGQRAAMTEALRAQMIIDAGPPKERITFTMVDGWSRYPVELVADTSMSWEQLVEAWYQKAALIPGWHAKKYPRVASEYVMKTIDDQVITHMDGINRVFAHYIPSTMGAVPTPPPAKQAVIQPPDSGKNIQLFVTEMVTGDTIQIPDVAKHDDAIKAAEDVGNIPSDSIITVIESKPTIIKMACAAPSYGLITPERFDIEQRALELIGSLCEEPRIGAICAIASALWVCPEFADHVGDDVYEVWADAVEGGVFIDYSDAARMALMGLAVLIRSGRREMVGLVVQLAETVITHNRVPGREEEEDGGECGAGTLITAEMPIDGVDPIAMLREVLQETGIWNESGDDVREMLIVRTV